MPKLMRSTWADGQLSSLITVRMDNYRGSQSFVKASTFFDDLNGSQSAN